MRNTDFEVILVDELKLSSEAVFDECAICLEHYNIHCFDTITPCNHRFCVNCIRILIQKDRSHITCPLCRQDIEAFINNKNGKAVDLNAFEGQQPNVLNKTERKPSHRFLRFFKLCAAIIYVCCLVPLLKYLFNLFTIQKSDLWITQ